MLLHRGSFKDRIPFEESALAHMYVKHEAYRKKQSLESHLSRKLFARPTSADAIHLFVMFFS